MEDKNNINSQLDFIGKDAFLKQKRVCVFSCKCFIYLSQKFFVGRNIFQGENKHHIISGRNYKDIGNAITQRR